MQNKEAAEIKYKSAMDSKANRQFAEAVSHYKKAVRLDPSDPRYWIGFGVCLMELRHWDQAILALERGIKLKPHYAEADARSFLARALKGAGRNKEARKQWKIISRMEPSYPSYEAPMEEARQHLAD